MSPLSSQEDKLMKPLITFQQYSIGQFRYKYFPNQEKVALANQ